MNKNITSIDDCIQSGIYIQESFGFDFATHIEVSVLIVYSVVLLKKKMPKGFCNICEKIGIYPSHPKYILKN